MWGFGDSMACHQGNVVEAKNLAIFSLKQRKGDRKDEEGGGQVGPLHQSITAGPNGGGTRAITTSRRKKTSTKRRGRAFQDRELWGSARDPLLHLAPERLFF